MADSDYRILEIQRGSSDDEVKKAYHRLARKHHPDKGGDPEKFKQIDLAFRNITNNKGEPDGSGIPNFNHFHHFAQHFQRQQQHYQHQQQRPKQVMKIVQNVPLDVLYNGGTIKIKRQRRIRCPSCNGGGGETTQCDFCGGTGKIKNVIRMANVVQTTIVNCNQCNNGVKIIKECEICNKLGSISEESSFSLDIKAGTEDSTSAILKDAGDYIDGQYADIQFVIRQTDHPRLSREGPHLILSHTISLYESLCGFSFKYVHLDKKTYHIRCKKGSSPGKQHVVQNLGMPHETDAGGVLYGNLIIKIEIHFDLNQEFNIQEKTQLKRILKYSRQEQTTQDGEVEIFL